MSNEIVYRYPEVAEVRVIQPLPEWGTPDDLFRNVMHWVETQSEANVLYVGAYLHIDRMLAFEIITSEQRTHATFDLLHGRRIKYTPTRALVKDERGTTVAQYLPFLVEDRVEWLLDWETRKQDTRNGATYPARNVSSAWLQCVRLAHAFAYKLGRRWPADMGGITVSQQLQEEAGGPAGAAPERLHRLFNYLQRYNEHFLTIHPGIEDYTLEHYEQFLENCKMLLFPGIVILMEDSADSNSLYYEKMDSDKHGTYNIHFTPTRAKAWRTTSPETAIDVARKLAAITRGPNSKTKTLKAIDTNSKVICEIALD